MSSVLKVDEIQNTDGKTGLVITPDGSIDGIKFPEEANPSGRVITSTTMSSYEEGEWTPQFAYGPTLSTSGITYSGVSGRYTRIGNMVPSLMTKTIATSIYENILSQVDRTQFAETY